MYVGRYEIRVIRLLLLIQAFTIILTQNNFPTNFAVKFAGYNRMCPFHSSCWFGIFQVIYSSESYLQVLRAGCSHHFFYQTLQTSVANTRNSNNFRTYFETTNYLIKLTPSSRALPEKVTGPQLVNKRSTLHRIQKFITALTKVRHLSLS
jgi:hypothetical protein